MGVSPDPGEIGQRVGEITQKGLSWPRIIFHATSRAGEAGPCWDLWSRSLSWKPTAPLNFLPKQGDPTLLPILGGTLGSWMKVMGWRG